MPTLTVSKSLAGRVARAFQAILTSVDPIGIPFRKSRSPSESGYFERRYDRLYLTIAEDLVRPDGSTYSAPCYDFPRENGKPSGYLTFSLSPDRYGPRNTKSWSESPKLPLEEALAQVAAAVRSHFVEAQEKREQAEIKRAKEHEEWLQRSRELERQEAIQAKKEKKREHAQALATALQARKTALLKAAENWRLSRLLTEFIDECERRWQAQSPALSPEQAVWLTWAREIAAPISPFSAGYPDPANDGPFDPGSVPFGGPYPATRNFK